MSGRTVYTGGTFDLIHPGHIQLLKACFNMAGPMGHVVVALNTDDFVERYKGHRPVMQYNHRAEVLRALRYVDMVIPNQNGEDSKPAILRVGPDIIAIGDDWAPPRDYMKQMSFTQEWLDEHKIKLVFVPLLYLATNETGHELHSSTRLRSRAGGQ